MISTFLGLTQTGTTKYTLTDSQTVRSFYVNCRFIRRYALVWTYLNVGDSNSAAHMLLDLALRL